MRTDADDPACVRDPTIEPLLSHTATLTDEDETDGLTGPDATVTSITAWARNRTSSAGRTAVAKDRLRISTSGPPSRAGSR
jgi:hypothetical protein